MCLRLLRLGLRYRHRVIEADAEVVPRVSVDPDETERAVVAVFAHARAHSDARAADADLLRGHGAALDHLAAHGEGPPRAAPRSVAWMVAVSLFASGPRALHADVLRTS